MAEIEALWKKIEETFSFGLASSIGAEPECIPWVIARRSVNWAAILAGLVLLAFLIYGGFTYLTSSGDPGKTEQSQKTIVNSVIGFAIVVLAWSVAGLITWLFGVRYNCGTQLDNAEDEVGEGRDIWTTCHSYCQTKNLGVCKSVDESTGTFECTGR